MFKELLSSILMLLEKNMCNNNAFLSGRTICPGSTRDLRSSLITIPNSHVIAVFPLALSDAMFLRIFKVLIMLYDQQITQAEYP